MRSEVSLARQAGERRGRLASLAVVEHLGLVGLSDSGHGGLFRALTGMDVDLASDRVLGVVNLPDARLDALAEMSASKKTVYATFQIAYLAG